MILEQRIVEAQPVDRLAAPAHALGVLVARVADRDTVGGPGREVDAAVLVAKQGIFVDQHVGRPVDADALAASVRGVVDGYAVARPLEEADPRVLHVAEREAHHGHVALALHEDAVAARDELDRIFVWIAKERGRIIHGNSPCV